MLSATDHGKLLDSAAGHGGPVVAVGDLGELYRTLSKRLERIVRVGIQAPDVVIEDACQFAWSRLVHHQGRVHQDTALGWLVKTAEREAIKMITRRRRESSLEAAIEEGADFGFPSGTPGPYELLAQRERLATVKSLPIRQRRLLWLYGLGLSYEEIARHDGCTSRTVERQLQRARAGLHAADRSGGGGRQGVDDLMPPYAA